MKDIKDDPIVLPDDSHNIFEHHMKNPNENNSCLVSHW